jgi:predicted Zn-dependent protease
VFYYYARATLKATPDRIDEASKAIAKAISLSPGDPWMLALAGRIAYEKHDYNGAVEHLRETLRLRPSLVQARFTLAQAYRALGLKDDAAREADEFQRLCERNPEAGLEYRRPADAFAAQLNSVGSIIKLEEESTGFDHPSSNGRARKRAFDSCHYCFLAVASDPRRPKPRPRRLEQTAS